MNEGNSEHDNEEQVKYISLNKVLISLVVMVGTYIAIEPIVNLVYKLIFNSNYIVYSLPYLKAIKFLSVAIIFIIVMYLYMNFIDNGKKIVTAILLMLTFGVIVSLTSYNTVNENELKKHLLLIPQKQSWENVSHVETKIDREEVRNRKNRGSRIKNVIEYKIFFNDGSSMNVWNNPSDNYNLHEYILDENIRVNHNGMSLDSFKMNYSFKYRKYMSEMEYIFYGIDDEK